MSMTFETLIEHNKRVSLILVLGMIVLLTFMGGMVALALGQPEPDEIRPLFIFGATAGAILGTLWTSVSYFLGSRVIMGISDARVVHYHDDPILHNVVEEMALAAGIPKPKIYGISDESPNAFATGRDPEHAIVAITTGLRKKLNRDELQAVVAHELAHIKNYDILLMMLTGVLAGLIVLISDFFLRGYLNNFKISGGRRGSSSGRSSGKGGGAHVFIIFFVALLLAWLAPLLARVLQLAVSREREYLADATAVKFCRNPLALASALKKIALDPSQLKRDNRATEHMYIMNPSPERRATQGNKDSIWSTHPPAIKRISKLRALAGEYGQQLND